MRALIYRLVMGLSLRVCACVVFPCRVFGLTPKYVESSVLIRERVEFCVRVAVCILEGRGSVDQRPLAAKARTASAQIAPDVSAGNDR